MSTPIYCPLSEALGIKQPDKPIQYSDYYDEYGEPLPPWNKGKIGLQVAWNKGLESPNKGKTYEEIYGTKKASELKKIRKEQLLNCNPMMKTEVRKKAKKSLIKFYENNESPLIGISKSEITKKKISNTVTDLWKNEDYRKNMSEKTSSRMMGNTVTKGRIWVTNGIINKVIMPGQIPEGFWKGRTQ